MSKQKCMKGLVTGMAAAMLVCGSNFANAEASAEMISDNILSIAADGIENPAEPAGTGIRYVWYYKKENGKSYRRLYDATNGKWVTDWILCS